MSQTSAVYARNGRRKRMTTLAQKMPTNDFLPSQAVRIFLKELKPKVLCFCAVSPSRFGYFAPLLWLTEQTLLDTQALG